MELVIVGTVVAGLAAIGVALWLGSARGRHSLATGPSADRARVVAWGERDDDIGWVVVANQGAGLAADVRFIDIHPYGDPSRSLPVFDRSQVRWSEVLEHLRPGEQRRYAFNVTEQSPVACTAIVAWTDSGEQTAEFTISW